MMKHLTTAAVLVLLPVLAFADEALSVNGAWIAKAPPGVKAHAGYLEIHNHGETERRLIAAKVSGYVGTMIHESRLKDGIASMHHLDEVVVAPGETITFKQHGLHLMLMGAEGSRQVGDTAPLTLIFSDGAEITVDMTVKDRKDMPVTASHDHSGTHDGHTGHKHHDSHKHHKGHKTQ